MSSMSKTKKKQPQALNTSLCYIEQDGQYLMLHRNKKGRDLNQGKWSGVGGKFEEGESPDECLLREVQEETGLTLTRYHYRGIVTFVCPLAATEYMHLFTADAFSGSVSECNEGELHWLAKSDVFQLHMWPGDRIFLHLLEQQQAFFSLKLVYNAEQQLVSAQLDGQPLDISSYLRR